ncbi:MAG: HD domain-containing protein [Minisyncoccia bacterium]
MTSATDIIRLIDEKTNDDVILIDKAYIFARIAHEGQTRHSGEEYFIHVVETAKILAELGMGVTTVVAGLLHDTVEDCEIKLETIEKEFGEEVAFLVDGVTKLGSLRYNGADRHNESLRKLFVAMSEDIRVLMIKLSDRLHNMRTLSHVPQEKQKRIATETLEIYAPIAYRLGIRKLNRELEDLAFPYVYPKEFENLKKSMKESERERLESLEKFINSVKKALAKEGLVNIKTDYRIKGLYSLYKKLQEKKDIEKIYDINAVRILVDTPADCYRVLGVIHGSWKPLPGRIKDYIAFPKPNGYQGIHTTIFTGDGGIVEIQIKTHEMHQFSEYGVASHITYKSGKTGKDEETLGWIRSLLPKTPMKELHKSVLETTKDIPHWIKELVAYQEHSTDKEAFQENLKNDFFSNRIFAFSPKGDVVDLPIDSTPIDFAYSIHSDIGNHMIGAKVGGKLVSLDTKLQNGDIVEIMTKQSSKPNIKWVEMCKLPMTKRHIKNELSKISKK